MRLPSFHRPGLHAIALAAGDPSPAPYEGPVVSIELRQVGGAAQATVSVIFATGGWELRNDDTKVVDGVGRAYLTFEGPGRDEMVTQALVEKEWPWRSEEPFSRAEVWVKVIRRGEPPRKPDYRLAAHFPKETE